MLPLDGVYAADDDGHPRFHPLPPPDDAEVVQVRVRRGKGGRDRVTVLPAMICAELSAHLNRARADRKNKRPFGDETGESVWQFGRSSTRHPVGGMN